MKYQIPKIIFGQEIKGAMERLQEGQDNQPTNPTQITQINTNIKNPQDYIQVPEVIGLHGGNVIISKFEIPDANNKNYEETHKFILQKGLYVPTPNIFMPHFANVCKAKKGETQLLDGNGKIIQNSELEDIYQHLTTNHISAYETSRLGAWTWLNARFIEGSGFNNLDLETIISIKSDGSFETKKTPLANCLGSDGYAKIKFNTQGFSNENSENKYIQGENIYFWKPVKDRVARFYAVSGRASLDCGGGPTGSNDSLGVFTCAEGASSHAN